MAGQHIGHDPALDALDPGAGLDFNALMEGLPGGAENYWSFGQGDYSVLELCTHHHGHHNHSTDAAGERDPGADTTAPHAGTSCTHRHIRLQVPTGQKEAVARAATAIGANVVAPGQPCHRTGREAPASTKGASGPAEEAGSDGEEDSGPEGGGSKRRRGSAGGGAGSGEDVAPERKRNRLAVKKYREKKKAYVQSLEEEVDKLKAENAQLKSRVAELAGIERERTLIDSVLRYTQMQLAASLSRHAGPPTAVSAHGQPAGGAQHVAAAGPGQLTSAAHAGSSGQQQTQVTGADAAVVATAAAAAAAVPASLANGGAAAHGGPGCGAENGGHNHGHGGPLAMVLYLPTCQDEDSGPGAHEEGKGGGRVGHTHGTNGDFAAGKGGGGGHTKARSCHGHHHH